ncbi:MAG: hypothetical protein FVQ79_11645 [Planctomycetes bacterium]|nr:hypothetical protein [Planctomycetota bacterium]
MGFQEDYEKARDKGKLKRLTKQIQSWDEEGQVLMGKCTIVEPFTEGQFDTEVNSYTIETDAGIISTVLGSATDKQLSKIDPVGKNIRIAYRGKKTLKDGRPMNLFDVDVW